MITTDNISIIEREQLLRQASDAYYNDTPIISDVEFDEMWNNHNNDRILYPNDNLWNTTILDRIGSQPLKNSGFRKIKHLSKMMSLDNAFIQDGDYPLAEVHAWLVRLNLNKMTDIIIEPKIDGLSASIIYEDGVLKRAVTRGDGKEGEDITENVIAADLVPQKIIDDAQWGGAVTTADLRGIREIRGEIYMSFASFETLCSRARLVGEDLPANPRNAAAGIIRRKDSSSLQGCALKFMAHGVEHPNSDSYYGEIKKLKTLGFKTAERIKLSSDKVIDLTVLRKLLEQPYPTDGVVFKLDSYKLREAIGVTSRAPKWAIALKFEQKQVNTICSAISIQVGRSGILTPVAELVPASVNGSVVSRATLHNESQVNRLGLMVGDKVVLQKAGGVIPEIVRVIAPIKEGRGVGKCSEKPRFSLLKHISHKCPSCGSYDIMVEGDMEDSKLYAELKLNKSSTIAPDGRLNLGECRRQTQAIADSLSTDTIIRLRDDNGMSHIDVEVFRARWLSDVIVNITADGLRYRCGNTLNCKAQMAARVEHMVSRGCLNIVGLGTEACDAIAQRGDIDHPFDILNKPVEWFAELSWMTASGKNMTFGKARATKVVDACKSIGKQPLNRWIASLGIHSIGENTSKEITRMFDSARHLQALKQRLRDDISIDAICRIAAGEDKKSDVLLLTKCSNHLGPVSCNALINFVDSAEGFRLLERIHAFGAKSDNHNPFPTKVKIETVGKLVGKSFCVTGTLSVARDEIHDLIIANGGNIVSSVTKNTNVLVAGDKAGSKMKKATDLGVEVWSEIKLRNELI